MTESESAKTRGLDGFQRFCRILVAPGGEQNAMTKKQKVSLGEWAGALLAEIDPAFLPTAEGYSDACVLMASYAVGADEQVIARELGFDREYVDLVGNRLRNAKIWIGDRLSEAAKARWDGEDGGIAILMDVNVAKGSMTITTYREEDGEPLYSLSPQGRRDVERLLKGTA